jgi:hypothetical protein
MRKFIKVVGIVVGAIIVLGIIGNMMGGKSNTEPAKKESSPKTETNTSTKNPVNKVTKESYDMIKTGDTLTGDGGMSVQDVKNILGEPNNNVESTSNVNNTEYKMETMTWSSGLEMKAITVVFVNGYASSKNFMQ